MYYIKKALKSIFTIFIISIIAFLIISLIPGNPEVSVLGVDAPLEKQLLFRQTFELDKPIIQRYISWLLKIVKGDFGISFRYFIPVKDLIIDSLPTTLIITFISLTITITCSIILSFYLNKNKNKYIDNIFSVILGIAISIPSFCLGLLAIIIFSIYLKIFKMNYDGSIFSLILPCIIIAIPRIAHLTYNLKEKLYIETRQEYVKYLYTNGMSLRYLNMYILKNSIISILSILGLLVIDIITGILIVEQVFSIPGIGRLIISAVYSRDIPLIQALIIYTSICVIVINYIIDILYSVMDKRIKNKR